MIKNNFMEKKEYGSSTEQEQKNIFLRMPLTFILLCSSLCVMLVVWIKNPIVYSDAIDFCVAGITDNVHMFEGTGKLKEAQNTFVEGYKLTQNLNISGNLKISNKWNMNFSSGWDFVMNEFTTTTMNISRDLHCFSMSCGVVLSPYMSYNFSIRANSSMLADALKYDQRSSSGSNIDWY